jgi:hypothetical protein
MSAVPPADPTERTLSLLILWMSLPMLCVFGLLAIDGISGGWNVHGFAGYSLLLLTFLVPLTLLVTIAVYPVLLIKTAPTAGSSRQPLTNAALVAGAVYLVLSVGLVWYLWPQLTAK